MATPPVAGGPAMNPEDITALAPAPGTDMTGICFKDQLWLNTWTETWCSITLLSHHSTTGLAIMSNSACAPFTHSTALTSRKLPTL